MNIDEAKRILDAHYKIEIPPDWLDGLPEVIREDYQGRVKRHSELLESYSDSLAVELATHLKAIYGAQCENRWVLVVGNLVEAVDRQPNSLRDWIAKEERAEKSSLTEKGIALMKERIGDEEWIAKPVSEAIEYLSPIEKASFEAALWEGIGNLDQTFFDEISAAIRTVRAIEETGGIGIHKTAYFAIDCIGYLFIHTWSGAIQE